MRLLLYAIVAISVAPACIEQKRAFVTSDGEGPIDASNDSEDPVEVSSDGEGPVDASSDGEGPVDASSDGEDPIEPPSDPRFLLTAEETEMTFFPGQSLRGDFIARVEKKNASEGYDSVGAEVVILFQRYDTEEREWVTLGDPLTTDSDGDIYSNYWERLNYTERVRFRFVVEETLRTNPSYVILHGRPTAIARFATGALHSCAATKDELFCWGYNGPPANVPGPRPMTEYANGDLRAVENRQMRINYARMIPLPRADGELRYTLPPGTEIVGLAVTGRVEASGGPASPATCISLRGSVGADPADALDGVWCVGTNAKNQLGNDAVGVDAGTWTRVRAVIQNGIAPLGSAESLVGGTDHFCAVVGEPEASSVYCWGDNANGQVAGDAPANEGLATVVALPASTFRLPNFAGLTLDAGHATTCAHARVARSTTSSLEITALSYCWGDNGQLQIPAVAKGTKLAPTLFTTRSLCADDPQSNLPKVAQQSVAFAVGRDHICTANALAPTGSLDNDADVFTACGVDNANTRLACAGSNDSAQLGVPLGIFQTPTWAAAADTSDLAPPEPFVQLAAGDDFTCGVTNLDRVYCWGANHRGQLGDDSTDPQASSQRIFNDGKFKRVWAAANHACALRTEPDSPFGLPAIFCWGDNTFGQSGIECLEEPGPGADENTPQTVRTEGCEGSEPRKINIY